MGGIFKARPLEWSFECTYNTYLDITTDQIMMDASPNTGDFAGTGQFDLELRMVSIFLITL